MGSDGQPKSVIAELAEQLPQVSLLEQPTADGITTIWVSRDDAKPVLDYLKRQAPDPFRTLYDLTAIDERARQARKDQPPSDFTVVYHLLSYERNEDVRVKVALADASLSIPTVTDLWPSADWYERELWDMFGIHVEGHPNLRRILMPPWWEGHPLRKEHPSRATEMGTFSLPPADDARFDEDLRLRPEEWGFSSPGTGPEPVYLNVGPQHPGTRLWISATTTAAPRRWARGRPGTRSYRIPTGSTIWAES